jgi:hypothetical protein
MYVLCFLLFLLFLFSSYLPVYHMCLCILNCKTLRQQIAILEVEQMSSLTKQLTKNLQRKLQNPRPQSLNLTVMLWRIQISKDENSTHRLRAKHLQSDNLLGLLGEP